jgi:hypothetical protein
VNDVVETLLAVANAGGQLGQAGDNLRARLPRDCPHEITESPRANKASLLRLLRLNFLVVRSHHLGATLFWTPDEAAKEALVAAGADPGTIYTADALTRLVNRRVTVGELRAIHAAKSRFNGKLTEP